MASSPKLLLRAAFCSTESPISLEGDQKLLCYVRSADQYLLHPRYHSHKDLVQCNVVLFLSPTISRVNFVLGA